MLKYSALLLVFLEISFSQVIDYHDCPYVEVVEDFNLTAYLGTWNQFMRYWDYFEIGTRCNTATYSLRPNGSIDVLDQNIYIATEKHQKMKGIANLEGNGTEGRLTFSYPPTKGVVGEYLILGTDYKSWSVVWSCLGIDTVGSVRYAWVYTREINPSEEVINATQTIFDKYQIPTAELMINVIQENCTTKTDVFFNDPAIVGEFELMLDRAGGATLENVTSYREGIWISQLERDGVRIQHNLRNSVFCYCQSIFLMSLVFLLYTIAFCCICLC